MATLNAELQKILGMATCADIERYLEKFTLEPVRELARIDLQIVIVRAIAEAIKDMPPL